MASSIFPSQETKYNISRWRKGKIHKFRPRSWRCRPTSLPLGITNLSGMCSWRPLNGMCLIPECKTLINESRFYGCNHFPQQRTQPPISAVCNSGERQQDLAAFHVPTAQTHRRLVVEVYTVFSSIWHLRSSVNSPGFFMWYSTWIKHQKIIYGV